MSVSRLRYSDKRTLDQRLMIFFGQLDRDDTVGPCWVGRITKCWARLLRPAPLAFTLNSCWFFLVKPLNAGVAARFPDF
jgi:hypothetical protein